MMAMTHFKLSLSLTNVIYHKEAKIHLVYIFLPSSLSTLIDNAPLEIDTTILRQQLRFVLFWKPIPICLLQTLADQKKPELLPV